MTDNSHKDSSTSNIQSISTFHAVEEVLKEDELEALVSSGQKLNHYIGFEISGEVHIGTGLITMQVVKQLLEKDVSVNIFLADWHAYLNNKLGGDIDIIREMAISYFKEAMIASAMVVGIDPAKLNFILANDIYDNDYWMTVMEVSKNVTLSRGKRSVDIAGRAEGEDMPIAILIYPMMQVADIFHQGFNLVHAGTDQRKAHVVARQVAKKLSANRSKVVDTNGEPAKPVAIHHHLLMGLAQPTIWPITEDNRREALVSMKMSKSKPDTAVFITDSPEDIRRKITKAFCPPGEIEYNPIIDWAEHIILPLNNNKILISRPEKFGGDVTYENIADLKSDFADEKLHPMDLKTAVAENLIKILEPAREHFEQKDRKEALEKLKTIRITR